MVTQGQPREVHFSFMIGNWQPLVGEIYVCVRRIGPLLTINLVLLQILCY